MIELESDSPSRAAADLREQAREATNVLGAGQGAIEKFNAYLTWAARANMQLSQHLSRDLLNELVTTPRYWSRQSVEPVAYGPALSDVLQDEITARATALERAASEVESAIQK